MVLKENMLCKCYNIDVPISYCAKGVSFKDKISNVGFEFLPQKGFWFKFFFGDSVSFLVFVPLMCISLV
jgi:hypothetical protein